MKVILLSVFASVAAGLFAADDSTAKVETRVVVTSQPAGASVILDGKDRGVTPITLLGLEPGRHHLRFRLAGYVERDRFFDMSEGPVIEKSEVLEEEKGLLLVKTDPSGCDLQIDGVSVGQTPRLVTNLPVKGKYELKLRKAGYLDQIVSVSFDSRRPVLREIKMVSASGTVKVVSDPVGAEVMVNGVVRGKTPVDISGVPQGKATVCVRLDGYVDDVRTLVIRAGDVQDVSVALKSQPGVLSLVSVPDGARFYVNGEARGKGPLVISNLEPGDYDVRAVLEGYAPTNRIVTLVRGETSREEFALENVMGRIEVRSAPAGATVLLDGRKLGQTRARGEDSEFSEIFPIEDVPEGEHVLVLRLDGYADLTRRPKVQSQKTSKQHKMRLQRVFTPNVVVETGSNTYRGVLVSSRDEAVEVEVKPGVTRSFSRSEIRKVEFLDGAK